jgi:hypothetical protein
LQIPYSSLNTQTGEIWSNILNSVHGWFKHCGYVQIVCVLYMIYRLVVQPNTTKADVFAETLLANGGVEMLLIILWIEAKSSDMPANLSSNDRNLQSNP